MEEKKVYKGDLVVSSSPKSVSRSSCRQLSAVRNRVNVKDAAGHAAIFLLKVAALETVRRVSKAKCPFLWRGFQALQVICYPPFNRVQKWVPIKGLIKGMQTLSRPLLVLSIVTSLSDQEELVGEASGVSANSDSLVIPELHSEEPSLQPALDASNEASQNLECESWLDKLHKELENQGISLLERINDEYLRRFYTAANGDFVVFLSSIKKTIRWRETYRLLSQEELETWANLVFWHGYDLMHRPCLIVRLGLACSRLPSQDRPRFAQAVISQVEHGVMHLINSENPEVTVLVDCEGLSPFRIPMQIIRSCSSLLQDHYPNCLGCLFVIRLPPVVRVIAQTFIKVLKPVTRKKLKIGGEMYRKVLLENLQTLPSYLGGDCRCTKCLNIVFDVKCPRPDQFNKIRTNEDVSDSEDLSTLDLIYQDDIDQSWGCLRTVIIGLLMLWVLIAIMAGLYDPENHFFPSQ
ncbi:SEC14 cytosolic factor family protein / phosphoglyceride transfer family protein, putative isoform 2 [Hibiscus syriacus]|uniref:SEC14 cytosolic factor family protein / phosphoglyceride transfer family protein, putative isoform 2 n=1 Tax=Hibiscus syriacus TaxID=106335 RepID=A0A6A2Y3Z3_HIBSY|nr:sec14 cytosolic factor-like [Hibiscus syriacus]KAE8670476.1 SEC14 cytosolic factor family protein / phosphoglyceride transfer family protein, putative isoform 2 [Hibiscus syriacus]